MKEVRTSSAVPFYGTAVVLALYAVLFSLYRLVDYCVFAVVGVVAFVVLRKLFPGTVEQVQVPVETGDADVDALLREGEAAVAQMRGLAETIAVQEVRERIGGIADVTDKIFKNVVQDPSDYRQVRRFADFFLPTTMKLLHTYDHFGRSGAAGENIDATRLRIEDALAQIHASYMKQYDALFANQALDIETDIAVLEALLKKEGLTAGDF